MTIVHTKGESNNSGSGATTILKQPVRLGQISFINVLPIVLPYESQQNSAVQIFYESPARLNAMFNHRQLEISAMSSFNYLNEPDLQLMPELSISCRGPVGSVLFFSKYDPAQLGGKKNIVVSSLSATSVNLLKILFAAHYGFIPRVESADSPDLTLAAVDAALVIGDRALAVDDSWSQQYHRLDLGAWWFETYQLPMTFGVWSARKDWVMTHPQAWREIAQALQSAKQKGLTADLERVLQVAQSKTGLSKSRLHRYFTQELNFDLSDEHLRGLGLYKRLAAENGLLAHQTIECVSM